VRRKFCPRLILSLVLRRWSAISAAAILCLFLVMPLCFALVFGSQPVTPGRAELQGIATVIAEEERFAEAYAKAVGMLADGLIEKLDSERPGLQKRLRAVDAELQAYLKSHPNDTNALLLQVRFDVAKHWAFWPDREPGAGRDPQKTLDRVLKIDSRNAEAYHRKARLLFSARSISEQQFAQAFECARKAVELSPQDADYRELVATALYSQGKTSEAADLVKPLQDGKHPMYRLLLDILRAPVPNGALFDVSIAEFSMQVAPEEFHQFRAAGYLYPGPASEVEAFYRKVWPEFKRQPNPNSVYEGDPENGFAAVFRWSDSALTFSPEPFPPDYMQRGVGEPAEKSPLKDALTLLVKESSPPNKDHLRGTSWEKLPAGFTGKRACEITWTNYRSFIHPP